MASLLKSIGNWIRGKKDEAANKLKDPVRDGKFAIEDTEKQIAGFTQRVATLVAQNKRSQRQVKEAEEEVAKWQNIAQRAIEAGNEDDARTALEKKAQVSQRLTTMKSEIERNEKLITTLRQQLNNARARVAQAKSDHVRLSARLEGAKIRQDLANASSTFGSGDSPLAQLDDLARSVEEKETEAEALEELAGVGAESGQDLEAKYGRGGGTDVEAELQQLMAKAKKKG
jgi:phage shock protein A